MLGPIGFTDVPFESSIVTSRPKSDNATSDLISASLRPGVFTTWPSLTNLLSGDTAQTVKTFPVGASFNSWKRNLTSVGPSFRGVMKTFARAPVIAPLNLIFILVSLPLLYAGMLSIGTAYAAAGVLTSAVLAPTFSPTGFVVCGITANPSGTALRKKTVSGL